MSKMGRMVVKREEFDLRICDHVEEAKLAVLDGCPNRVGRRDSVDVCTCVEVCGDHKSPCIYEVGDPGDFCLWFREWLTEERWEQVVNQVL